MLAKMGGGLDKDSEKSTGPTRKTTSTMLARMGWGLARPFTSSRIFLKIHGKHAEEEEETKHGATVTGDEKK